jgi:hypothetical protein
MFPLAGGHGSIENSSIGPGQGQMKNLRMKLELLGVTALIAFVVWWVFAPRSYIGDSEAVDRCVAKTRALVSFSGGAARTEMYNACRDVFENEDFRERFDAIAIEVRPDSRTREYTRAAQEIYCPDLDPRPAECDLDIGGLSPTDADAAWFALRDSIYHMEIGGELTDRLLNGMENAHEQAR